MNSKSIKKKVLPQGVSETPIPVDYNRESQHYKERPTVISIRAYREMLADNVSTDEQILRRLRYLEALCRNVIKHELKTYISASKKMKAVKNI